MFHLRSPTDFGATGRTHSFVSTSQALSRGNVGR